jgi:hypothetical protein
MSKDGFENTVICRFMTSAEDQAVTAYTFLLGLLEGSDFLFECKNFGDMFLLGLQHFLLALIFSLFKR